MIFFLNKVEKNPAMKRLFYLFKLAKRKRAKFARICDMNSFVRSGKPALFIKHDIHASPLNAVVKFAKRETKKGIRGSYFFMPPGHPITKKAYSVDEQLKAMKDIQDQGHEVGLHIDPHYLIHHFEGSLQSILEDALRLIRSKGIEIKTGNMHGHTGFKGLDENGYGTSVDFFEEIERQPDFPDLKDVEPDISELIRKHRTSLESLGIQYWADTFLWSQEFGCVELPYLSDNYLKAKGCFHLINLEGIVGHYAISQQHPPSEIMSSTKRHLIPIQSSDIKFQLPTGKTYIPMNDLAIENCISALTKTAGLLLIHPQHYI